MVEPIRSVTGNSDVTGTAIGWTVVEMTLLDVDYFVQEFSRELKDHPDALRECSRWWNHLLDMACHVLDAIREHVSMTQSTVSQLAAFQQGLGRFVGDVDQSLGISLRQVVTTDPDRSSRDRVRDVAARARQFRRQLAGWELHLRNELPEQVTNRIRTTRRILAPPAHSEGAVDADN